MKNTEQYGPTHLIEPYRERRARSATARKASIERERARLVATYTGLGLPVPSSIVLPADKPFPEPVKRHLSPAHKMAIREGNRRAAERNARKKAKRH